MAEAEGGGSAFPQHANTGNLEDWKHGMDLRDYFAAAAMAGIVRCTNGLWNRDQAAQEAYAYADAMLKAREV